MADMMVAAEIGGGALQPGRHYIPTCPSPAQLIQRGELPGQIERFGITDGKGADQADMLRHHGQRRQDRRRLEARSEEHTSELQSLMRSSYAVFCLKKKTPHTERRQ